MNIDNSMTSGFNNGAPEAPTTGGFSVFPSTQSFPPSAPGLQPSHMGMSSPPMGASSSPPPPPPMNNGSNNNNNNPMLGMMVAKGPIRTDFVPTDPSFTKFTLSLSSPGDLPSPLTLVNELVFFFLPNATLPPNTGVLIYWQLETIDGQQSGFELLGSLIPQTRPSDIFRTGWSGHDQFISLATSQQPAKINFGISVEPIESVENVSNKETQITSTTSAIAHKIGEDLFNFMRSFDTNGATGNQTIAVPANTFDKWWQKFEHKLQRDPNFLLKES